VFADSTDLTGVNTKFNKDLAIYCIEHCIAAETQEEMSSKLSEENWKDVEFYNYDENSEDNSSFSLARKDKIVILTIRQTHGNEWYGNFNVADNGIGERHESFNKAAQNVVSATKEYINKYIGDSSVKLLVTGYSRGAAVANLVAKDMGDTAQVFAYTFATPNTTTDKNTDCDYIFNIINPEDMITLLPLTYWGYSRYGTDIYLPTSDSYNFGKLYNNMNEIYKSYTDSKYVYYGNDEPQKFARNAANIASDITEYNTKNYYVYYANGSVTPREYFKNVAALLCVEYPSTEWQTAYDFLNSTLSTSYNTLTNFLMNNYLNGKIVAAHSSYTYYSWLLSLDNYYFTTPILGDVDCDNVITANDAALVLEKTLDKSFILPIEDYADYISVADTDNDGELTAQDAATILQISLGQK
jgi:hypothetical protein